VTLAVVLAGALAVLGTIALWPRGDAPDLGIQPITYVDATVTAFDDAGVCYETEIEAPAPCQIVSALLTSGPDKGNEIIVQVRPTQFDVPDLDLGDKVVLRDVAGRPPEYRYTYADFQRATPLAWLVVAFVVVVVAFGRWQGARALLGLVASGLVLVAFVVPALLRSEPALLVALAGTIVIAFVALYLAHGVTPATTVALAGTLVSLAVTALLAVVVVAGVHMTGLSDENARTLRVTTDALDLRGLLIAGIVVGALGVLDDVTVTQVSTVGALRRANPALSAVELYREASRVGRDHVASTVNTLVLAYAGASLPLLLFFTQRNQPVGRLLSGELIAVEIVRMVVGSIGLILSVPITTALAAAVLGSDDDTGHDHGGHQAHVHAGPGTAVRAGTDEMPGPAAGRRRSRWDDFSPDERNW